MSTLGRLESGLIVNDLLTQGVNDFPTYKLSKSDNAISKKLSDEGKPSELKRDWFIHFCLFLNQQRDLFKYNFHQLKKNKCRYCLGFLSCVLVVIAVTVSFSASEQLPLIFLRLAENSRGQQDMRIYSNNLLGESLNFTSFTESLQRHDQYEERYSLSSPRIFLLGAMSYSAKSCYQKDPKGNKVYFWNSEPSSTETEWFYNDRRSICETFPCIDFKCSTKTGAKVLAIDTERERIMNFGKSWDYDPLKPGEAIISENIAGNLGVTVGDDILIKYQTESLFFEGWFAKAGYVYDNRDKKLVKNDSRLFNSLRYLIFPLRVKSIEDTFQGKNDFQDFGDGVIYVEYESLFQHLGGYTSTLQYDMRPDLVQVNPYHFSHDIHVNIPDREQDYYNSANFDTIRNQVTRFFGEVLYLAGLDQVSAKYRILEFLKDVQLLGLYLRLVVDVIITILVGLSVLLIYSLMMVSVEERNYEMGVLRTIGLKRYKIAGFIITQSFLYSFPSIFFGLLLGQSLFAVVAIFLEYFLSTPIPYFITASSIGIAVGIVIFLPLVSSILPIRKALGHTLAKSLEKRRSKTKAVKVKIERMASHGMSWSLLIVSFSTFAFGCFVYYFFPYALITNEFEMMIMVFFVIILMMLIGCIVFSLNFERILQVIITKLLLFWEYASVKKIVLKNLIAHKSRNRKTTLMYAVSLGFIILISVAAALEVKMYEYSTFRRYGTRLTIFSDASKMYDRPLTHDNLMVDFDKFVFETENKVEDYAYMSYPLSWMNGDHAYRMRTVGGYDSMDVEVTAISPNFYDVLDPQFLEIFKEKLDVDFDGKICAYSVSEQLYTSVGANGFLGDQVRSSRLGVRELEQNVVFEIKRNTERFPKYFYHLFRFSSILDGAASSSFTKYSDSGARGGMNGPDIFVSFPNFLLLMNRTNIHWIDLIPIRTIHLKISESATESEVSKIKSDLHKMFREHKQDSLHIHDTDFDAKNIRVLGDVMNYFSYVATVFVMIMCFFSLTSNMYVNVKEQSKEIGVLRAIGCRKCTIRRIFIYESLVLIYTASVIGMVIGTFIGYTLVLQQQVLTQLPIAIVFPWELIIVVIIVGIFCAVVASLCPINSYLRKKIVRILK